jgi:hypothetical protein
MIALRENCIHPTTNKPYILDSSGGRDNSPEGHQVVLTRFPGSRPFPYMAFGLWHILELHADEDMFQGGFSHAFVSHFASDEDRKYYLEKDPAHLAFVKSLDGIIQNVRVVDYEPGVI